MMQSQGIEVMVVSKERNRLVGSTLLVTLGRGLRHVRIDIEGWNDKNIRNP